MLLLIPLFFLVQTVSTYNFRVFCPLFGHSHTTFFAKIANTLAEAGHDVTFFTPTICRRFSNVSYVKPPVDVVHLEPSEKLAALGDVFENADISKFWTRESSLSELLPSVEIFNAMYAEQVEVLRDNLDLLDRLKEKKFDVMISESFIPCGYPVLDYLQIETFLPAASIVLDIGIERSIGQPVMPSVTPFAPPVFEFFLTEPKYKSFRPPHNIVDIPAIQADASFLLTNSNPYIDYPRPLLTKNVQIGGVSVDVEALRSQKVDEQYDKILNLRKKSVLVSFGSVMHSRDMPLEYKKAMITAMKKFPEVTFIWKYEGNDTELFSDNIQNVHFSKWIPQTALLADSRLSAFLTHAGLGSVNEVSYLGKPSIMCPLFGDQMRNAKMLARHNGSIELSKYDLGKPEKIEDDCRKILFDHSYTLAAKKLALQLEHQPVKPKELVLKHAEFAARFGRLPSLDPYSRQMSFIQYFLLDVAAILASIALLIFYFLFRLSKRCLQFTFSSSPSKQKTN